MSFGYLKSLISAIGIGEEAKKVTGCGSDLAVSRNQPTYSLPMGDIPDFKRITRRVKAVKGIMLSEFNLFVRFFNKMTLPSILYCLPSHI